VAKYADMWNGFGTPDKLRHKLEVLRGHCEAVGRDESQIEKSVGCKITIRDSEAEAQRVFRELMAINRTPLEEVADDDSFWVGTPVQIAEKMIACREVGIHTFISEMPAPYDEESIERWIVEVKPMVEQATAVA
jgi:alkanesulfonate monooxygenase SsuD/methylene tetrahydromethanopterin reductase-like flavin-dependent oxidoreductase (luciferase family)